MTTGSNKQLTRLEQRHYEWIAEVKHKFPDVPMIDLAACTDSLPAICQRVHEANCGSGDYIEEQYILDVALLKSALRTWETDSTTRNYDGAVRMLIMATLAEADSREQERKEFGRAA